MRQNFYITVLVVVKGNQSYIKNLDMSSDTKIQDMVENKITELFQEEDEWNNYTVSVADIGWNPEWFLKSNNKVPFKLEIEIE